MELPATRPTNERDAELWDREQERIQQVQRERREREAREFLAQFTQGDPFGDRQSRKEDRERQYTVRAWRRMPNGTVERRIFRKVS